MGFAGGGAATLSWPFAGLLCLMCWLSGAMAGYAVRMLAPPASARRPAKPKRRRQSSYYFSEDERRWGDQRWLRRLAWVSVVIVVTSLVAAGTVALANYKSRPNAAAGYRRG